MKSIKQLNQTIQSILTSEKQISEQGKYRFICMALAFIHFLLTARFYFLEYTILFLYNILAIALYLVLGLYFSEQKKYAWLYYGCYTEITFFAAFATLLAGWNWGFMIYLIAFTPVSFYLAYSSPLFGHNIKKPLFFVLVTMLVFAVTRILSVHFKPIYTELDFDTNLTVSYLANAIIAFLGLMFFSVLFTIEIRQNEIRLEEQYRLLETISSKDPLTGLINRRSMDHSLLEAVEQSKKSGLIFSVILGDIDDFKRVNDTYGHNVGDKVLVQVADMITKNCTEGCRICRWGGEEILIFVPENEIITKGIAEKIRQSIEKIRVETDADTVSVTMTFGMTEYSPGLPLNKLVSIADNRLYYGKEHGKNQVVSKLPDDAPVLDK